MPIPNSSGSSGSMLFCPGVWGPPATSSSASTSSPCRPSACLSAAPRPHLWEGSLAATWSPHLQREDSLPCLVSIFWSSGGTAGHRLETTRPHRPYWGPWQWPSHSGCRPPPHSISLPLAPASPMHSGYHLVQGRLGSCKTGCHPPKWIGIPSKCQIWSRSSTSGPWQRQSPNTRNNKPCIVIWFSVFNVFNMNDEHHVTWCLIGGPMCGPTTLCSV